MRLRRMQPSDTFVRLLTQRSVSHFPSPPLILARCSRDRPRHFVTKPKFLQRLHRFRQALLDITLKLALRAVIPFNPYPLDFTERFCEGNAQAVLGWYGDQQYLG